jgi:hypothetical protein
MGARSLFLLALALFCWALPLAVTTARAQELEPLQEILDHAEGVSGAEARSLTLYRIPFGYTIRDVETQGWGLRLTLPMSLGAHDLRASSDFGDLIERVQTVGVMPGVELQLRAGDHWRLKPFGEVGVTASTWDGDTELLYALGLAARGSYQPGPIQVTLGGEARYASPRSRSSGIDDYSMLSLGVDAQAPLGVHLGSRAVFGGLYAIGRAFPGLDFPTSPELDVGQVWEVGLSFSTEPVLRMSKVKLPWLAVGYRFGDVFTGIRVSFTFPF